MRKSIVSRVFAGFLVLVLCVQALGAGDSGVLARYVAKPDDAFGYRLVEEHDLEGGKFYLLRLVSQSWRTKRDVDRPKWWHWLDVYVPDKVVDTTALMVIAGGNNSRGTPEGYDRMLAGMALDTRTVTSRIRNVPNQPLVFNSDPERRARREDEILAFAWARHLDTGDPEWLVQLAMVKSAVRGMDAVSAFCRGLAGAGTENVDRFVLTGASKRGWTTWLTAAVDKRVIGAAPMVIDMLNTEASMDHHHDAYGRYSPAIADYVENRITDAIGTAEAENSLEIIDPYFYRDSLNMPKLIMNSTGDQFFLPDSWRFYWNELRGPSYLRYIPNTDHGLNASAGESLRSFYSCVLAGEEFPEFEWKEEAPGRIRVRAVDIPAEVFKWSAVNPSARDFRMGTIGKTWECTELSIGADGVCVAQEAKPAKGWAACLVELVYPDPRRTGKSIRLTTGVSVIPDSLPFAEKGNTVD